ncbi:MAG: hypothetical protein ACYS1C_07890 [Planctomycetota bacterium]|jgi:hypothetical protein
METVIEAKGLSRRFGRQMAVDRVDFAVRGVSKGRAIALLLCLAACAACGRGRPQSVKSLAAGLREQGLRYEVSETASLPKIRCEGLRLLGPELEVEIFRIDNDDHLELVAKAAGLASAAQALAREAHPVRTHVRAPYLIVVRREPADGQVAAALSRLFAD